MGTNTGYRKRVNYWEDIGKLKGKRTGCRKDERSSSRGTTIQSSLSAITGIKGQLPGDILRWKMMVSWWLLSGDNAWKEMRWDWAEGEANSSCRCSWSLSQPHGVPLRGAPRRGKGLCLALSSSPALGCPQVRQLCIVKEAVTYKQLLDTAVDLFSDFAPHHTKFKTLRRNRLAYLVMCSQFGAVKVL